MRRCDLCYIITLIYASDRVTYSNGQFQCNGHMNQFLKTGIHDAHRHDECNMNEMFVSVTDKIGRFANFQLV